MVTAKMNQPEKVILTYDKTNTMAIKTLEFFLSLGLFRVEKISKSQIEVGLEEYRKGKYTVINKGKSKIPACYVMEKSEKVRNCIFAPNT